MLVPLLTTDALTQLCPTAAPSTPGEDKGKKSVVFIRRPERDPLYTKEALLSFPPWETASATLNPFEWQRDKEASYMSWWWSLLLPSKLPYGAISCIHQGPSSWPPGGTASSAAPHPPLALATSPPRYPPPMTLISARLPSVTRHTLKSHQSSLEQQKAQHQQNSFCLYGTKGAESSFVRDLTPHTDRADREKVTVNLFKAFILDLSLQETQNCTNWQMWQLFSLYSQVIKSINLSIN